ncbi:MAG TPA: sulfurtransferase [Streptosporangiaceae bacterium]|jgi:thiosulfate/3-mercaptopyruvate sulfurtransferase|nr:sulfurtransferase [Streptosporangiaceae bacterium]
MTAPEPLISAEELAEARAGSAPPVLLDVRWRLGGPPGIDSYHAGHLPGASYLDLDTQLAGPPGDGGRHPLPAAADFEATLRAAGVRQGSDVVVYDDGDSTIAARLWWMLRYFGHDRVRVLDGGFRGWAAAGLPVSTDDVVTEAGDVTAQPGRLPVLDAAGAAELARSGMLLDARAPARYRGETEPVDRLAGHIPGALSAPTAENVTSDGLFRPVADLRARFADLGVAWAANGAASGADGAAGSADGGPPQVGVYCGSGVTAAHEVLALTLAGIPAALYVGSWSGWVADPDRPVATGPKPG